MIIMKPVIIGNQKIDIPLIQGGMGVGISRSRLSGAVAKEGGMGVISAAQIGYDRKEFAERPEAANLAELAQQIKIAKQLSQGNGMIGVNIMAVTQLYGEYVRQACQAGADAIITGAGLPTSLPQYTAGFSTKIAPIVSSGKAAQVILKYWDKKYSCTADFIVVEGPRAGGHLGFSFETLAHLDDYDFRKEVKAITAVRKQYEEKYKRKIPLFLAGGIMNSRDVMRTFLLGADGVQVASRFVVTEECDAAPAYKQAYIRAEEKDIAIIHSPVGMPGRALKNAFIKRMEAGQEKITGCYHCLKACNPKTAPYCITQALVNAVKGDVENGLIFCGARVGELKKITTVKETIEELGLSRKVPCPGGDALSELIRRTQYKTKLSRGFATAVPSAPDQF